MKLYGLIQVIKRGGLKPSLHDCDVCSFVFVYIQIPKLVHSFGIFLYKTT